MQFPNIPGYEIVRILGRGARGVVYLAKRGHSQYAIKLHNSEADNDSIRSGAILACIRHPGIPVIVEVGAWDSRPFFVREYIAGSTLSALLDTEQLLETRIVEMAKTLAGALEELHRQGLIHRDIKPDNVMVSSGGEVKLIDYGFAAHIAEEHTKAVGTYLYSAPEQTGTLDAAVDQRTDLYALGGVLFHCAAGTPPYVSDNVGNLLQMHATAPIPKVREKNPDISPAFAAIIEKLLAKDPNDRYQSGQSLVSDLRSLSRLNQKAEKDQPLGLGQRRRTIEAEHQRMVGRELELDDLLGGLETAREGHGQSYLVSGEAGSGKSLLAREFLHRALPLRPQVLRCRCQELAPPFAAIADLVDEYFRGFDDLAAIQRKRLTEQWRKQRDNAPYWVRVHPGLAAFFGLENQPLPADAGDRFFQALVELFVLTAELHGCLIVHLDDVHFLDESSRRVISRLRSQLNDIPVFLLATARTESEYQTGLNNYIEAGSPVKVALGPLGDSELEELTYEMLGSRPLHSELVGLIQSRSNGNGFAAAEYIRTMLRSGLLLPNFDGWSFDPSELSRLELPEDLMKLVITRLHDLPRETRALLTFAAAFGNRFRSSFLAVIQNTDQSPVIQELELAAQQNIVEHSGGDTYIFVHEKLREALLAELTPKETRSLHTFIAKGLEKLVEKHPELSYARARHYSLGNLELKDRIYQTSLEAGKQALQDYAFEEAYEFLTEASKQSSPDELDWVEPLSRACARTNRVDEAIDLFNRMLAKSENPEEEGRYLVQLSKLRQSKLDRKAARDECHKALAAMGRPVNDSSLLGLPLALGVFLAWIVSDVFNLGNVRKEPEARERQQVLAELYRVYSEGEYFDLNYVKMLEMASRACFCGLRLGTSREKIMNYSNMQVFFGMIKRVPLLNWWSARIEKLTDELQDPVSSGYHRIAKNVALHMAGYNKDVDEELDRALAQSGLHLDPYAYMIGIADLAWSLFMRGYVEEAWTWIQKALDRCRGTSSPVGVDRDIDILSCYAISCLSVLGRSGSISTYVDRVGGRIADGLADRSLSSNFYAHKLALYMETREFGEPFQETGAEFLKLKIRTKLTPLHRRHFFVFWGAGWLEKCWSENKMSDQLKEAERLLNKTADRPILAAHARIVRAGVLGLQERWEEGLEELAEAQKSGEVLDAPWVLYEANRWKARLLERMGHPQSAARAAELAYRLAQKHRWPFRAKAVVGEFSEARSSGSYLSGSHQQSKSRDMIPAITVSALRQQKQFQALLNLSLASAQFPHPNELAQIVLDELNSLLNAERAYLFRYDEEDESLEFVTGRNHSRKKLEAPSGYSQTVVESAARDLQPLIIAGTEQGEALGAQSVVALDLRSIICAPLVVREELKGVVYLDNRLARGVFNKEDLEILKALSNHIAISMETARIHRLEVEVESEKRQRALAEVVSDYTRSLGTALEQRLVCEILLSGLERSIAFDRAAVWLGTEEMTLAATQGYPEDAVPAEPFKPKEHTETETVILYKAPLTEPSLRVDPTHPSMSLDKLFSLLCLPITSDGEVAGMLVLSQDQEDAFSRYEIEIASAFCNQSSIALANAQRFKEIELLATTDSLTGLFNRGHFFSRAEAHLSESRETGKPCTFLMTDVDFFKKFNDTHGHACGDEVLREVGRLFEEVLQDSGTVARYGGEEFVAALVDTDAERATELAEALRKRVEEHRVHFEGKDLQVTLSIGLSTWIPDEDIDDTLGRADDALYVAKDAGRNCVKSK